MAKKKKDIGGYLVLVGLFIGLGIGVAINEAGVGVLIGLGVGFLASFVYAVTKKKK